ncbi:MAG: nicotinate (nicotinamide) nucleotide adenylyltransferase [SAR202 cluster bacterium]|nr:nicotinate (nicotinamide) nucleotide adenylyltransferase [SAR202 cluster bacterium]
MGNVSRVGIFGGTFDPIHTGHLGVAQAVREALALDIVLFVPAARPRLRAAPVAGIEQRVEMTRLAIDGRPWARLSLVDVVRAGPAYSIDTISDIRRELGPAAQLFLIIGADALLSLPDWRQPDRIASMATIVCVGRPGGLHPDSLPVGHPGRCALYVEGPMLDVAASEIRERLASGVHMPGMVPEAVQKYIASHGLYRDKEKDLGAKGIAEEILALATELKALQFGDFTLSSGQKSTYYFDGRLLSLDPRGLAAICEAFLPVALAAGARAVGGPTIGADPIVGGIVLLSQQRGRPLSGFIVRSQAKQHGTGRLVEGHLEKGAPVAILDDTVSTGGSLFKAIEAAEASGNKVVKVMSILDRHQGGSAELKRRGYDFFTVLEATPEGKIRPAGPG